MPAAAEIADQLGAELISPYCPGRIALKSCRSPGAQKMRESIEDEAEAGRSADQIKAALVAEHGPEILGNPQLPGFAIGIAMLAALGLGILGTLGRRCRPPAVAPCVTPPTRDELEALDDALDEIR